MTRRRLTRIVLAVLYPCALGGALWSIDAPAIVVGVFAAAAALGAFGLIRSSREVARPPAPLDDERCPRCGARVDDTDKDTSSGRDLRTMVCAAHCGWSEVRDGGMALWKAMSRDE